MRIDEKKIFKMNRKLFTVLRDIFVMLISNMKIYVAFLTCTSIPRCRTPTRLLQKHIHNIANSLEDEDSSQILRGTRIPNQHYFDLLGDSAMFFVILQQQNDWQLGTFVRAISFFLSIFKFIIFSVLVFTERIAQMFLIQLTLWSLET